MSRAEDIARANESIRAHACDCGSRWCRQCVAGVVGGEMAPPPEWLPPGPSTLREQAHAYAKAHPAGTFGDVAAAIGVSVDAVIALLATQ